MLRNNLKIAWRNLWKHKGFSALNIFGLAIGITCAAFILLWVEDEIRFDTVFPDQDLIYMVPTNQTFDGAVYTFYSTPGPLANDLKEDIPEITKAPQLGERKFSCPMGIMASTDTAVTYNLIFLIFSAWNFWKGMLKPHYRGPMVLS